jgi:hypothetical protein
MYGRHEDQFGVQETLYNFTSLTQVLWNCLVWHFGPLGAAGILASVGTFLLDYKMGVPLARPHWEGVRRTVNKVRDVKKCVNTTKIVISREVLWNCLVWHFGPLGAAGILTSAAHPLWIMKGVCPLHDL